MESFQQCPLETVTNGAPKSINITLHAAWHRRSTQTREEELYKLNQIHRNKKECLLPLKMRFYQKASHWPIAKKKAEKKNKKKSKDSSS
jgi:hypothetical protein